MQASQKFQNEIGDFVQFSLPLAGELPGPDENMSKIGPFMPG